MKLTCIYRIYCRLDILYRSTIKEKKLYIIPVIIELIIIIVYGSRGPILCLMVYIVLSFIYSKFTSGKKASIAFIISFSLILFIIFKDMILIEIANILSKLDLSSRTLNLLINSQLSYDSGRSIIWEQTIKKICEKPLLGWGVAGELSYTSSYPHNVFLEILLHYGLIFGGIICILIFSRLMLTLVRYKRFEKQILIFLCAGLIPLFLSGTYLMYPMFWILIGLLMRKHSQIHQHNNWHYRKVDKT